MQTTKPEDLNAYDFILVGFSGGKDSIASVFSLIEDGADPSRIELWHNNIDGREAAPLMDWESTPAYCRAFAKEFGFSYYESWREGGFEREMLRNGDSASGKVWFETPEGLKSAGGKGPTSTVRMQFPQVGGIASGRWCSAILKIDVMAIAINNQTRFLGKKILVVTGERAEESATRAAYASFELHRCNTQSRTVHAYRPVHKWTEAQVWDALKRHSVNPHPAYRLGWGRLSCMTCIFGGNDQWRSVAAIAPDRFDKIAKLESRFGKTINRRESVIEKASKGSAYAATADKALVAQARSTDWDGQIRVQGEWQLPAGAFSGQTCGPS